MATDPIETRLLVIAAMLDKAVAELHRVMDQIKETDSPEDSSRSHDD